LVVGNDCDSTAEYEANGREPPLCPADWSGASGSGLKGRLESERNDTSLGDGIARTAGLVPEAWEGRTSLARGQVTGDAGSGGDGRFGWVGTC
jgi:hypothetical protein